MALENNSRKLCKCKEGQEDEQGWYNMSGCYCCCDCKGIITDLKKIKRYIFLFYSYENNYFRNKKLQKQINEIKIIKYYKDIIRFINYGGLIDYKSNKHILSKYNGY